MVIVGLSVIATVLVLQYHHHDPDGGHMPHWVSTSANSFTQVTIQKYKYKSGQKTRYVQKPEKSILLQ